MKHKAHSSDVFKEVSNGPMRYKRKLKDDSFKSLKWIDMHHQYSIEDVTFE
jgi:hypothetical protein